MTDQPEKSPRIYREVQYFRQIWLWLIILFVAGLMWYNVISRVLFQRSLGSDPIPLSLLSIFWLLFGVGLPLVGFYARLITEVRADGLYIRFVPFHLSYRKIPFDDIEQANVRRYNPLREYGGWGIRWHLKGGRAYNVSGNRGVQLRLAGNRRLLIGSQRPEALLQAIRSKKTK
jgi:hypothetical protein